MYKLNLLCVLLYTCVSFSQLFAQDNTGWPEFETEINSVFQNVDMTGVSSGLLLDRNMTFLNIHDFNGKSPLLPYNITNSTVTQHPKNLQNILSLIN